MATDYAALYADHDQQTDHWWWRPGWGVGTRFYAWHITLDGQDDLHQLIDRYQAALADEAGLDPVPHQWRHITMTGIGHFEDVPEAQLREAVEAVREAVSSFGAIETTFGRAAIFKEAIALPPSNPEVFTELQNLAQQATAKIIPGADKHNPNFRAHVSTHYSNSEHPTADIRQALDAAEQSAPARFPRLDLIRMHRDRRMYEWDQVTSIPFGE